MKSMKRSGGGNALIWALMLGPAAGCGPKNDAISVTAEAEKKAGLSVPGIEATKDIAEEAFVFGLPLVMNYAVMSEFCVNKDSGQYKGPFNTVVNETHVATYKDTAIVTPNSDTPYSLLWLDLRAEPMTISVPAVPKERYYSVQLTDGNLYNYGYVGSRSTGSEPGTYLVVGPDWKGETPAGIKQVFRSTTPLSFVVFRTQLFRPDDMPEVVKIQAGYKAEPLSAFLKQPAPPAAPIIDFLTASSKEVKANFFEYLDFALKFVPETDEDKAVRAKLARIGVGPGKSFEFKDLSLEHKAVVLLAMKEGDDKIEKFLSTSLKDVNGWKIASPFGDRAFYKGNWMLRAAAAKAGIYGNDSIEAAYPFTRTDGNGETLDCGKHSYTLTFPAGQLPPTNAFWSVTMYDGKTQLLIENPIGRYLINSPMLPDMKKNDDGSLTLYISKAGPGKELESNWLPAPDGTIYLVMRLYWPRTEAPSILPAGSGSWQPPAVVKAK